MPSRGLWKRAKGLSSTLHHFRGHSLQALQSTTRSWSSLQPLALHLSVSNIFHSGKQANRSSTPEATEPTITLGHTSVTVPLQQNLQELLRSQAHHEPKGQKSTLHHPTRHLSKQKVSPHAFLTHPPSFQTLSPKATDQATQQKPPQEEVAGDHTKCWSSPSALKASISDAS